MAKAKKKVKKIDPPLLRMAKKSWDWIATHAPQDKELDEWADLTDALSDAIRTVEPGWVP